jgi:hypothetical protein
VIGFADDGTFRTSQIRGVRTSVSEPMDAEFFINMLVSFFMHIGWAHHGVVLFNLGD